MSDREKRPSSWVQDRRDDIRTGRVRRDFEKPRSRRVSVLERQAPEDGNRADVDRAAVDRTAVGPSPERGADEASNLPRLERARKAFLKRLTPAEVWKRSSSSGPSAPGLDAAFTGPPGARQALDAMQAMTRGFGTLLAQAVGALLVLMGGIVALAFFVFWLLYQCHGGLAEPFIPLAIGGVAMAFAFGATLKRIERRSGLGLVLPFLFMPPFFVVWFVAAGSQLDPERLSALPACW